MNGNQERDQRKRVKERATERMNDVVVISMNWFLIIRGVKASSVKVSALQSSPLLSSSLFLSSVMGLS